MLRILNFARLRDGEDRSNGTANLRSIETIDNGEWNHDETTTTWNEHTIWNNMVLPIRNVVIRVTLSVAQFVRTEILSMTLVYIEQVFTHGHFGLSQAFEKSSICMDV
jgi:hypothetical protein